MTAKSSAFRLVADYVVVPGTDGPELLASGAVDVTATGAIAAVGTEADLDPPIGTVYRVGGLLMPGLVNAHAHGPMTLVRSAGDGLPLQRWLTEAVWPREGQMTPDDVRVGMTVASMEMLLAGVTTSVEMYLFEDPIADAVVATGGRAQIMAGVISAIAPDDAAFTGRLDAIDDFYRRRDGEAERITVGVGPHSVYDLGPDRLRQVVELAQGLGVKVHVHLEETRAERQQVLAEHGVSATQLLRQSGALYDEDLVAAHGVWLDDDDIAVLGQARATVVHCPQSNLKLGSGIAPVRKLLDAGVRVAIGTDGAASNDNLDVWEDMRLAALLARGHGLDPTAMSATQAFDLATRAGAKAIGYDDVGELRAGAWADIVRVDLDHPAFVPGRPEDLLAHLVWSAGSGQVTDVWVAGRQVVDDGEITTVERHAVLAEARTIGRRLAGE